MESRTVNTRVPAEVLDRIDAEAKRRGLTRTALLLSAWESPAHELAPATYDEDAEDLISDAMTEDNLDRPAAIGVVLRVLLDSVPSCDEPSPGIALPADLQAFVAVQAKARGMPVSEWIARCVKAAQLTLEDDNPPAKLAKSAPFKSRLKGEWKAP